MVGRRFLFIFSQNILNNAKYPLIENKSEDIFVSYNKTFLGNAMSRKTICMLSMACFLLVVVYAATSGTVSVSNTVNGKGTAHLFCADRGKEGGA